MAIYPHLVQIAWNTIDQFINDWQHEPYRWAREIDIQAEIANRISIAYKDIDKDTVIGNYKDAIPGFEKNQKWNRVCCEPKIIYTYKDKKKYPCYPDIVIWDDIDNPDSPPDQNKNKNWPMLWICEIKLNQKEAADWDINKMKYLINQGAAKYGCWLNLNCKRANKGNGISWVKLLKHNKLWSCTIMLPKK